MADDVGGVTGSVAGGPQLPHHSEVAWSNVMIPPDQTTLAEGWEYGIEESQSGSEHAAVGLGEEHRDSPTQGRESVGVFLAQPSDQAFAFETA